MLQIIADGRTLSFGYSYGLVFKDVLRQLIVGKNEIASYYQSNKEKAENELDTLITSFAGWD